MGAIAMGISTSTEANVERDQVLHRTAQAVDTGNTHSLASLAFLQWPLFSVKTQSSGAMWTTQTAVEMRDRRATGHLTAGLARRAGARPRRRKAQKVSLKSWGE